MCSLWDPITLPCGQTVSNRLVKVAMYEHLASFQGGPPNENHLALYSEWARHDWGMIVTGNIQIDPYHLTLGRDMVIPRILTEESIKPFRALSEAIHNPHPPSDKSGQSLAIMQLNHSGRQSTNFIGGRWPFQRPLAPSSIRVGANHKSSVVSEMIHGLMFQTPKTMTSSDIDEMVAQFVHAAKVAHHAQFDGVQLHVAHGYLLAQFMSPKSNTRTDDYSVDKSLNLLHRITLSIREVVPRDFALGIKLNAADYFASGSVDDPLTETEAQALEHVLSIAEWGTIDFIEISGGDYERPDFMLSSNNSSKSRRQAFFSRFAHQAVKVLDEVSRKAPNSTQDVPLILLTGGLRTPGLVQSALENQHGDLFGIGRGSVLCPHLPRLLRERGDDPERWNDVPFNREPNLSRPRALDRFPLKYVIPKIQLIGAGVGMAWYIVVMRQRVNLRIEALAAGKSLEEAHPFKPDYTLSGFGAVFWMWAWTPSRGGRRFARLIALYTLPFITVFCITVVALAFNNWCETGEFRPSLETLLFQPPYDIIL